MKESQPNNCGNKKKKPEVLTVSSDKTNRGRQEKKKTFDLKRRHAKEKYKRVLLKHFGVYLICTHTFCSSDVDRAGDVGEALVHAHLEVNHPENKKHKTLLITWRAKLRYLSGPACVNTSAASGKVHPAVSTLLCPR